MIKNHIVSDSSQIYFDFGRAEGIFLWDKNGKKFIDFTSGWNVCNLGWNNQEIKKAVQDQLNNNVYAPFWMLDEVQKKLAAELIKLLPDELNTVVRATGGTEANEEAFKIARAYTNRTKIIGFKNSYHGQSATQLALTYSPEVIMGSNPQDFIQIDFPTADFGSDETKILLEFTNNLENVLKNNDVAAIATEAGIVTGGGQNTVAPIGFMRTIRDLCDKYEVLFILDEVGTGFSRCGKLFGMEIENVIPDIATFAKALSNGAAAIGALVTKEEIIKKVDDRAVLISTFGWTPLACAAALKVLEIHQRDRIWEKAEKDGDYIIKKLREKLKNNPKVKAIRGKGMEISVLLHDNANARELYANIINNGLLIAIDGNNLLIIPPLTTPKDVLDDGLDIFIRTIQELN
jgi:acetylornithine/succinyldiaminopimelate/putrescine aminotransferase